jgi:hypothetical protein
MMGHEVSVAYYTTNHGVMQQQQDIEAVYHGKTFHISKEHFSENAEVDFKKDLEELAAELEEQGLEPLLAGGTVERYETWSADGKEVWVMYRIPCKKT